MSIPKVCCLAIALAAVSLAPASAGRILDEGKLDTSWFGDDREFRKADEIDYLWVKPGFSLSGTKVQFAAWEAPETPDPAARLSRVTTLFEQGLLTTEEYETTRAAIIAEL